MLAQWIGDVIGEMHIHRIPKSSLAEELGVTREYVSMVLNGQRSPVGAEDRFRAALARLIEKE